MQRVVRGAASPIADNATVSAPNHSSRVSLTAFLRSTTFSQHDVLSAITGASLYSNCSPRVKVEAVSNRICGSNGNVQHADSSLREKVSLCKYMMTHKILHTRYCPIHLLMTDSKPIERHSIDGKQL